MKSLSGVQFFATPWTDCNLPGASVHGILQAWILEWVAISFSRGSSCPRDWTLVSRIVGRRLTIWATREVPYVITEMQIKTVGFYYTLTQMAEIWNTQQQMLRKMWYNSNSLSLLIEIQNGTTTLEDNLAVSYKVKYSIWSNSCVVWYLPPKMESLHPHEDLHMNAYSRFIFNCQDSEVT